MIVGVPREIKAQENRVALTPLGGRALVGDGHTVLVQEGAGAGSGFADEAYAEAGATLVPDAASVFGEATLLLKVKEPLEPEYALLRPEHLLFTYLHLAALPELARVMREVGCTAVAYETVTLPDGSLPLLRPMSAVAGRVAVQVGAHHLERQPGGRGVLLAGIPGVKAGRVVILGGGTVGSNAAQIAIGLGADVTLLDTNPAVLHRLDLAFRGRLHTLDANPAVVAEELRTADLVVGAVLVAGARAPTVVTRAMLRGMPEGAVAVDVAIDQGGCLETARPTTHAEPTYVQEGVVHYCVTNMPGAVPRTSTLGLTGATLPYVRKLAAAGTHALQADSALQQGLNVQGGRITHAAVAEALHAT